jgi:hypothetical protein
MAEPEEYQAFKDRIGAEISQLYQDTLGQAITVGLSRDDARGYAAWVVNTYYEQQLNDFVQSVAKN